MLATQATSPGTTLSPPLHGAPEEESRHAIYFTPPVTSSWWRFGRDWLGRDPVTGWPAPRRSFAGLDDYRISRYTRAPSLYGFHATLKAPMRLAPGRTAADLNEHAARIAAALTPVVLTPLRLELIGGFVALTLAAGDACSQAVAAIAHQCVTGFDPLRALPTANELRRRQAAGLDARQTELLQQWGYPFVFDEFRFHMTLSGRMDVHGQAQVMDALAPVVRELNSEPLTLDALSVCVQPRRDAPFVLASRHAFGGAMRGDRHE